MAGELDEYPYETTGSSSRQSGNSLGAIGGGIGAGLGLGFQALGAYEQYQSAQQIGQASKNIAGFEQQQDVVRQTAMHVAARRQSMEALRKNQQARAMGLATGTQQAGGGYLGSSALGGSIGEASGITGNNLLGINQNLEAGDQMFALNRQISQQKINIADAQSGGALGAGLGGLGKSLSGSIPAIMNLAPMLV